MAVRSSIFNFGENAGKIWNALQGKELLREKILLKTTNLKENEFYAGVGWLARENKILKEVEGGYKLGDTNLTNEIGTNAGRIWKILDIWGEINISSIVKLADIDEKKAYAALGWLAREDKIGVNENQLYKLR